ncbi:unnamed protein product [Allacma fusca]|uniref:Uncharacterized protein n=1 Tax=Allacma fusca TaxID=39272 RepID=A0A8J2PFC3_9HEXA|nr:unnamed protein product [Allacma fusca]
MLKGQNDDQEKASLIRMDIHGDEKTSKSFRGHLSLAPIIAVLVPIIFPVVHMLIFIQLWGHMTNPVDRNTCTCSCWDTVFKGPYESGIAKYKHVYFNSNSNVVKMWIITVVGVVVLSLHSHYYAWWVHWNYWNDDFYELWNHQVFFTVSELTSSALVVYHLDRRKPIQPLSMLLVANIALFHVITSASDQFFYSVILQHGHLHQVLRDILLMCTDLIQTGFALYELKKYVRHKGLPFITLFTQRKHFTTLLFTTSIIVLSGIRNQALPNAGVVIKTGS